MAAGRPRKPADPDRHRHAFGGRLLARLEIDAVRPDVDAAPTCRSRKASISASSAEASMRRAPSREISVSRSSTAPGWRAPRRCRYLPSRRIAPSQRSWQASSPASIHRLFNPHHTAETIAPHNLAHSSPSQRQSELCHHNTGPNTQCLKEKSPNNPLSLHGSQKRNATARDRSGLEETGVAPAPRLGAKDDRRKGRDWGGRGSLWGRSRDVQARRSGGVASVARSATTLSREIT